MRKPSGFTLIELLVVIAIIGVLAGLLLPSLRAARIRARVVKAQSDLRQIALALQMYYDDSKTYPPARMYCFPKAMRDQSFAAPDELVTAGYLVVLPEDVFNPGHTYKYVKPGIGFSNNMKTLIPIYVPENYPSLTGEDKVYFDTTESPVPYALWSVGPSGPKDFWMYMDYPVPERCRYRPSNGIISPGVIVHISDGRTSP